MGCALRLSQIAPLAQAGADFVAVGEFIFEDPRGPALALAAPPASSAVAEVTRMTHLRPLFGWPVRGRRERRSSVTLAAPVGAQILTSRSGNAQGSPPNRRKPRLR